MEINSVPGVNPYAASNLDSEKSQVEGQNRASSQSDVSPQDAKAAQQAFEVNISQEAQQLAAAPQDTSGEEAAEQESSRPAYTPPQSAEGSAGQQQASQIVNIVA